MMITERKMRKLMECFDLFGHQFEKHIHEEGAVLATAWPISLGDILKEIFLNARRFERLKKKRVTQFKKHIHCTL